MVVVVVLLLLLLLGRLRNLFEYSRQLSSAGSHQFGKRAQLAYATIFEHDQPVELWQKVQLVRHQYDGLASQQRHDGIRKDVAADIGIHGTQRIIHENDVGSAVDGARDRDALLLTAAQVDTALANLSTIAGW